jgi:hypothetical protein
VFFVIRVIVQAVFFVKDKRVFAVFNRYPKLFFQFGILSYKFGPFGFGFSDG